MYVTPVLYIYTVSQNRHSILTYIAYRVISYQYNLISAVNWFQSQLAWWNSQRRLTYCVSLTPIMHSNNLQSNVTSNFRDVTSSNSKFDEFTDF